jgi:predicted nucleic acid-binding protein
MFYVDTSALMKLIVAERDSEAMRQWMDAAAGQVFGNDLLRTEFLRAVRRSVPAREEAAHHILQSLLLVRLRRSTYEAAAESEPKALHSLDALHLASALEFGGELDAIVTYDDWLSEAAQANGIATISPS